MKDGLYIVDRGEIHAAFVVRDGRVTMCAPVLRKNFKFLSSKAKWVATDVSIPPPEVQLELVTT